MNERLDICFVLNVVGEDGCMADEVCCAGNVAALWRAGVERGIDEVKRRSNTSQVLEGVESVGIWGIGEALCCKKQNVKGGR